MSVFSFIYTKIGRCKNRPFFVLFFDMEQLYQFTHKHHLKRKIGASSGIPLHIQQYPKCKAEKINKKCIANSYAVVYIISVRVVKRGCAKRHAHIKNTLLFLKS